MRPIPKLLCHLCDRATDDPTHYPMGDDDLRVCPMCLKGLRERQTMRRFINVLRRKRVGDDGAPLKAIDFTT